MLHKCGNDVCSCIVCICMASTAVILLSHAGQVSLQSAVSMTTTGPAGCSWCFLLVVLFVCCWQSLYYLCWCFHSLCSLVGVVNHWIVCFVLIIIMVLLIIMLVCLVRPRTILNSSQISTQANFNTSKFLLRLGSTLGSDVTLNQKGVLIINVLCRTMHIGSRLIMIPINFGKKFLAQKSTELEHFL